MALAPTLASASEGGSKKEGHGQAESKSTKPAHGLKTRSTGTASFIEFAPAAATIFNGYRPSGLMHFEYGLDIEDEAMRHRAVALAPRLRDAYGKILAQYAGSLYSVGEVPDANFLSTRMQAVTDRLLGKGKATFLISTLMVQ